MKLNSLLIAFLLISMNALYGQESLNNYKYVIVPKNYDFLKTEDQYQLNSLTKFLFTKEGFETLFDTDITPRVLAENPCSALKARVTNNSSMFATKLVVELLDCQNQVVFTSMEGRSKLKDFKKGYHEALRVAFQSISAKQYSYSPSEKTEIISSTQNSDNQKVESVEKTEKAAVEEVKEARQEKSDTKVNETVSQANTEEVVTRTIEEKKENSSELSKSNRREVDSGSAQNKEEKSSEDGAKSMSQKEKKAAKEQKEEKKLKEVKEKKTKKSSKQAKKMATEEKSFVKAAGEKVAQTVAVASTVKTSNTLLYAQETPLGYQLVNSTPELVFILIRSSKEEVYILKNKQGFVFKENDQWFAEYFDGEQVIKEAIQIKF